MSRNDHIVRRSGRSACAHRFHWPLRLPSGPVILLVAGVFVALMPCDMAAACGWYRVRSYSVSPYVAVSCSPRVYCYDPCASSYSYNGANVAWDTGCGVSSAGCDTTVVTTPTLAAPHETQRPPTPAPSLDPVEAASPTDLPTDVDQGTPAPPEGWAPFEPVDEQTTPPASVTPALPLVPAIPITPATEPPAAEPEVTPPAATEAEATTPVETNDSATPPAAASSDLFGGAMEPPAAAPAEPPATDPATTEPATPAATPEDKLEGLFDTPPADAPAPPAQTPPVQTPPATDKTEPKASDDSLQDLFNNHRQDRPASGGLASAQLRRWTDNTGRYSCQGRLVRVSRTAARILKQNGRTTTVALARLSQLDRAFVQAEVVAAAERDGVRVAQQ